MGRFEPEDTVTRRRAPAWGTRPVSIFFTNSQFMSQNPVAALHGHGKQDDRAITRASTAGLYII